MTHSSSSLDTKAFINFWIIRSQYPLALSKEVEICSFRGFAIIAYHFCISHLPSVVSS